MRKTRVRKTKRGGAPAPVPISDPVQFRAYNDEAKFIHPNDETPDSMRAKFSLALIGNMRYDDPTYDPESSPPEELDQPFKIHRIRGVVVDEIFVGTMTDWDNNKINDFLVGLQPGDHIRLTIA